MLCQGAQRLPAGVKVVVLSNRGFVHLKAIIRSVCALSRLCFILAVSTLYVTAQGVDVVPSVHCRPVHPHWFRGNSYFPIGWDWVKMALIQGWQLIDSVRFTHAKDTPPAMASRKQQDERTYGIEFKIHTYQYACD